MDIDGGCVGLSEKLRLFVLFLALFSMKRLDSTQVLHMYTIVDLVSFKCPFDLVIKSQIYQKKNLKHVRPNVESNMSCQVFVNFHV